MTEQMKQALKWESNLFEGDNIEVFEEGANWYRNNVWHDASEKPEKERLCVIISDIQAIGGNKHMGWYV